MKRNFSNALTGVVDYGAYPLAMLCVAPVMLRSLGASSYGVWLAAMAMLNIGAIAASGFGDANIQRVAALRHHGDHTALHDTVRAAMSIHLVLGIALFGVGWMVAASLALKMTQGIPELTRPATEAFRIVSIAILLRAIESVCVSTVRGFEQFARAIRISAILRVVSIAVAAAFACSGFGLVAIVGSSTAITAVSTVLQIADTRRFLCAATLAPAWRWAPLKSIFTFGFFSWLLAIAGVVFTQADRLLVGAGLGATALAAYGLSAQICQPTYGALSAGLHFLFPHLASTHAQAPERTPHVLRTAVLFNLGAAIASVLFTVLFGRLVLNHWIGTEAGRAAAALLPLMAAATGLMALSIPAYYAALALEQVRVLATICLAAAISALVLIRMFTPVFGVNGAVYARAGYGLIMLLSYLPLSGFLFGSRRRFAPSVAMQEEA